jgi:hypothetical protein
MDCQPIKKGVVNKHCRTARCPVDSPIVLYEAIGGISETEAREVQKRLDYVFDLIFSEVINRK